MARSSHASSTNRKVTKPIYYPGSCCPWQGFSSGPIFGQRAKTATGNSDMKTSIAVHGACGRMGQRIVQLAHEDSGVHLAAAIDSPAHPQQGKDIGELCG